MTRNRYYQGPVSDHFDGTLFHGPGAPIDKSRGELLRLMRTPFAPWPKRVEDPPPAVPAVRVEGATLKVTTIGHASHLVQTRGLNILIDPVWSSGEPLHVRRTETRPAAGSRLGCAAADRRHSHHATIIMIISILRRSMSCRKSGAPESSFPLQ